MTQPHYNLKVWPEPQFWWLQTGGWLLYPVFIHLAYTPTDRLVTDWSLAIYYTWEGFLGFTLSLVLREVQKRLWHKAIWLGMFISFLSVAIAAEVWTLGKLVIYNKYFPDVLINDFWTTAAEWYPNSLTILAAWSAIYYGFKYRNTLVDRERSLLAAQTAAKDAQLRMLRYQLNPHFLFNTLANICALISDNKANLAKTTTMEISEFLRYSLANDPLQTNDLKDEIHILKLYFNIEKIRYANRLNYRFSLANDTLACRIPSMILQPLVENAIKYAIAPSISQGTIIISSYTKDKSLILSVKDDGPGQNLTSHSDGAGIGMKNTRERLTSFYGNQHSLQLLKIQPHGLEVRITIPLEYRYEPSSHMEDNPVFQSETTQHARTK